MSEQEFCMNSAQVAKYKWSGWMLICFIRCYHDFTWLLLALLEIVAWYIFFMQLRHYYQSMLTFFLKKLVTRDDAVLVPMLLLICWSWQVPSLSWSTRDCAMLRSILIKKLWSIMIQCMCVKNPYMIFPPRTTNKSTHKRINTTVGRRRTCTSSSISIIWRSKAGHPPISSSTVEAKEIHRQQYQISAHKKHKVLRPYVYQPSNFCNEVAIEIQRTQTHYKL